MTRAAISLAIILALSLVPTPGKASHFPPAVERWRPLASEIGPQYGWPPDLILAIIEVESQGNPAARNPETGAAGLMQIMPLHGLANPYDPATNIREGSRLLRRHVAGCGGSLASGLSTFGGYLSCRPTGYSQTIVARSGMGHVARLPERLPQAGGGYASRDA